MTEFEVVSHLPLGPLLELKRHQWSIEATQDVVHLVSLWLSDSIVGAQSENLVHSCIYFRRVLFASFAHVALFCSDTCDVVLPMPILVFIVV